MMLDGFISLLIADSGVNGLVSGRVYKSVLPRGYGLPAIAIHRYGGTQDYQFDGPVDVREDQVQLDTYGLTAGSCQQVTEAVRSLLVGYVGTLPDGTLVQACFLERDMDMPFLPNADSKGIANRSTLGFRVVSGGSFTLPLTVGRSSTWHSPVESVDGVRVIFTFNNLPTSKDRYFLIWNGMIQAPDSFTQNANQLTVSPPPALGTELLTYF